MDPLQLAAGQLGLNENAQRGAIQEYLSNGGVNLDPATTAWCAAFVNSTLKQAGIEGTGSNLAKSFLDWGQGVDASNYQNVHPGDIWVESRGDPNGIYGHTGIIESINPDGTVTLIAGNAGDAVSRQTRKLGSQLGIRRAPDGSIVPDQVAQGASPTDNALRPAEAQPEQPKLNFNVQQQEAANFLRAPRSVQYAPIMMQRQNILGGLT